MFIILCLVRRKVLVITYKGLEFYMIKVAVHRKILLQGKKQNPANQNKHNLICLACKYPKRICGLEESLLRVKAGSVIVKL